MGTSFLPFSLTPSSGNQSKATSPIISRKEAVVLSLISICSLGAGVVLAQSLSAQQIQTYPQAISHGDHAAPYRIPSVTRMVDFLREEAKLHNDFQNDLQDYKAETRETAQQNRTEVRVNGQDIPVSENGEVNKTINTQDGNVQIKIESHSTQSNGEHTESSSSRSRKSTSINIRSNSESSINSYTNTEQRIRSD